MFRVFSLDEMQQRVKEAQPRLTKAACTAAYMHTCCPPSTNHAPTLQSALHVIRVQYSHPGCSTAQLIMCVMHGRVLCAGVRRPDSTTPATHTGKGCILQPYSFCCAKNQPVHVCRLHGCQHQAACTSWSTTQSHAAQKNSIMFVPFACLP